MPELKINPAFLIGDAVYLKTDVEQLKRLVIGIDIRPHNNLLYLVTNGITISSHYEMEMTAERNDLLFLNIEFKEDC